MENLKRDLTTNAKYNYIRNRNTVSIRNSLYRPNKRARELLIKRDIILVIGTVISTFIYNYLGDKYLNVKLNQATGQHLKFGVLITLALFIMVYLSYLLAKIMINSSDISEEDFKLIDKDI